MVVEFPGVGRDWLYGERVKIEICNYVDSATLTGDPGLIAEPNILREVFDRTIGRHPGPLVGQVQVLDVGAEQLLGAGGGLMQQLAQRPLPRRRGWLEGRRYRPKPGIRRPTRLAAASLPDPARPHSTTRSDKWSYVTVGTTIR